MASEMCEFPRQNATSTEIAAMLRQARTVAVVGLSEKPERESYRVAAYMQQAGYRIIPVNPAIANVLGEKSYPTLLEIPEPIDIVNIFRKPEAVPEIVEAAIQIMARAVWMQEGIVHNEAAERARAAGLLVVMNRCLFKEHVRLPAVG